MTSTTAVDHKGSVLKKATRFGVMLVLTLVPGTLAARVLGILGKGPLRFILALVLEPLLKRIFTALFGRYARESNEKTTK